MRYARGNDETSQATSPFECLLPEPVFPTNRRPQWILVPRRPHNVELYFVDALTGTLTTYMNVGGGCTQ